MHGSSAKAQNVHSSLNYCTYSIPCLHVHLGWKRGRQDTPYLVLFMTCLGKKNMVYVHGAMATLEALISSVARVAESRPSMVSLEEILFTHSHSRKFLGTCFHSKFPATFCHWPSRKMDNSLPKGVPNSLQKVTNRVVLVPRNAVHTFCKKT